MFQPPSRTYFSPFARITLLAAIGFSGVLALESRAIVPQDYVVDIEATVSPSASPYITLNWSQRLQSKIASQKIYRRQKNATSWALIATVANTATSFADTTAVTGVEYEYRFDRKFTTPDPAGFDMPAGTPGIGYLSAGVNVPAVEQRGTVLLVIDNTMVAPLAPEITQLKEDLAGDGWMVQTLTVARTDTPPAVRALIAAAYNSAPTQVKSVYLLGHVPVPYSGLVNPDGHADHYGAWPADVYYGDVNGSWTDTTADNSTTSLAQERNRNVPGDGKFDQVILPSVVELGVGRVDLSQMTQAPAANISETALLRRYLNKVHNYRHRAGLYANVPRKSMLYDYWGSQQMVMAMTGWKTAFESVGRDVTVLGADQWFPTAASNTFLWAYTGGSGSFTSVGHVGNSTDFGRLKNGVVFSAMCGSYFGDWDSVNNFLRAPLAGNADEDSLGIACYWAGRPMWYSQHLSMGETLGFTARLTQNSDYEYNYQHWDSWVALMGDPTLRFHMVEPPRNLAATSANGQIFLKWSATTEPGVIGYHVFRAATPAGPFTRVTTAALTTPSYTDTTCIAGQTYTFMVRTLKLETSPGGTYQNYSQGVFMTGAVNGAATAPPYNPSNLVARSIASNQTVVTWSDNSTNESKFYIWRKTGVAGTWGLAGQVNANTTTFTDPAAVVDGTVYYYRVQAATTTLASAYSNESSVVGKTGFFDLAADVLKVDRGSGVANVILTRFGGTIGAASLTAATSNATALAGTDYTSYNQPVAFADGEGGDKPAAVAILNSAQAMLPRTFKVTASVPTGGAPFLYSNLTRVVIEDSRATLPAPWLQAIIGGVPSDVVDYSPAGFAEDAFGSSIRGGGLASTGYSTAEAGQFIYQSRTGDGTLTAYIDAPLDAQTSGRFALMVRQTNGNNLPMAAALSAGDSKGCSLATRGTKGASLVLTAANTLQPPCWLRLTRVGNIFTSLHSTDGITWNSLGSATVALPATANWGLFHSSSKTGEYQLARFRDVTLTTP